MTLNAQQTADGVDYRDLNQNGQLDPYEDPRLPVEERIDDLLSQMTLAEKAGLMFHNITMANPDGSLDPPPQGFIQESIADAINNQHLNHFNVLGLPAPRVAAEWHNRVQQAAEATRLGIPVTISSDPRHSFSDNPLTGVASDAFSQWPEPIGFAAIDDAALVEQFGDIARQEYVAVGIRVALHPMADLATEPRWARISGTFGENAELSARLTAAYIRGFQGAMLGPTSVACMTKHFPGGGPQQDGEDPHFAYGREQVYPGDNFDYHLIPFVAAFAVQTAQIMPYYGIPLGIGLEEVGFAFNKDVITGMLREKYGFDGVVCADWGILTDKEIAGQKMAARAWGVEHLTPVERTQKALEAGVDQFGGEACPEIVIELVEAGNIKESRIDESVRRLLRDKFRLGLFDNPYVDVDAAVTVVGKDDFRAAGELAQRKAIVLLKNALMTLPLRDQPTIYIENIDPAVAANYGQVVTDVDMADIAIVRLQTPYEPRNSDFLESMFHAGNLTFSEAEKLRLLELMARVPTIVDIFLDRPAVIPEITDQCVALLGNFGASDAAVLDVIFGRFTPTGKLPFELPSSMEAVRAQRSDVPGDSENPLFAFGHGLTY